MKRYRVINRITREQGVVDADSAQEACKKFGWLVGNCYVGQLSERYISHTPRQIEMDKEAHDANSHP